MDVRISSLYIAFLGGPPIVERVVTAVQAFSEEVEATVRKPKRGNRGT